MRSFIRWQPAPIIEGYAEPSLAEPCPAVDRYTFSLPIKEGDRLHFIANAEEIPLLNGGEGGIGLMNWKCENVAYELGTFVTSQDERQRAFELVIPTPLPEGCYYLVWYEKTYSTIGEWTTTASSCVIDPDTGLQNRFQQLEQEREITGLVRTPLLISNPLKLVPQYLPSTKILEFKGEAIDFGNDYPSFPDFRNILRLPVTIAEANHLVSTKEYRQTNGYYRRGNTYVDKRYILHTAYLDEQAHDAMQNALLHDELSIDGKLYFTSGEYKPEHQETALVENRYHPIYPASVELTLQGYNQINRACDLEPSEFKIYNDNYSDAYA